MRLAREEHCTGAEIARRLGFSTVYVWRVLRANGVRLRPERHPSDVPHGERLYNLWARVRCKSARPRPKNAAGKAVRSCEEWRDFWCFYDWAIASGYKPGAVLSVVGDEREATPKSCRWISVAAARARRWRTHPRVGRPIRAFGESKSVPEWIADPRCNVEATTLRARLQRGYAAEAAISIPAKGVLPKPRAPRRERAKPARPDWKEIVRLRRDERLTVRQIAERTGTAAQTIYSGLQRFLPKAAAVAPLPHGKRLRAVFHTMRRRCVDPNDLMYPRYGGRGARVSSEWTHFTDFHTWAIAAGYRPGLDLTRKPGKRIYSPANCRWAEREETWTSARPPQHPPPARRIVEAFGERKGIVAWSRDPRCDVTLSGLHARLDRGMDPEEAIVRPSLSGPRSVPKSRWIQSWGETKTKADWLRDRRCKVSSATLAQRLKDGMEPEKALGLPPHWQRRAGSVGAKGRAEKSRAAKVKGQRARRS